MSRGFVDLPRYFFALFFCFSMFSFKPLLVSSVSREKSPRNLSTVFHVNLNLNKTSRNRGSLIGEVCFRFIGKCDRCDRGVIGGSLNCSAREMKRDIDCFGFVNIVLFCLCCCLFKASFTIPGFLWALGIELCNSALTQWHKTQFIFLCLSFVYWIKSLCLSEVKSV